MDEKRGRPRRGAATRSPPLGLPYAHYLIDLLPFFSAFFTRLGARVEVLRPDAQALADGDRLCAASGSCAPVKILHGLAHRLAQGDVDFLFLPKIVNLPPVHGKAGTYTCPMAQGAPGLVEQALRAEGAGTRVVRPVLLRRGGRGVRSPGFVRELARSTGFGTSPKDLAELWAAHRAGLDAQRRYEEGLHEIGRRAQAFARGHGYPVVLVVGETHVVHDPVLNSQIHELVAANGAVALPLDCFAVPDDVPPLQRVHWGSASATLRAAVAAARAGDVFPLLLGAYGCGPNSFVEHLFNDLLEDYPHTVLESDGHGGKAGYVTRVQAFLHSVRGYRDSLGGGLGAGGSIPAERLERYDTPVPRTLNGNRDRPMYFGNIGGVSGRQVAAAMRGSGLDVTFVGATGPAALEKAREGCSGKECLPYQLIWGTLAAFLEEHPPQGNGHEPHKPLFVSIGRGFEACRANVFPLAEQLSLERLGMGEFIEIADFTLLFEDWALTSIVWIGLVAIDLLNMMRFYHLATEPARGDADAAFAAFGERLTAILERRRSGTGVRERFGEVMAVLGDVERLMGEAARAFGRLAPPPARAAELRDVFLCGDIYLRVDEWGNDDLQRKLADQGLRPIFEPFSELFELLALRDVQDHGLASKLGAKRAATLRFMRFIIDRLLGAARARQPWMFWHDVRAVDRAGRPLFDGYPFGETIPTIGSALLTWRSAPVDGVVVVSPRGCGPALISEAELRREAEFPLLFVYNDGDPIDEARLAGFAWRLRGRPARSRGNPGASVSLRPPHAVSETREASRGRRSGSARRKVERP
jgi:predicted nucleotide-binding protein (sugar kinase/HSP70/actin superfamily)